MLYLSLLPFVGLVALAHVAARRRHPAGAFLIGGLVLIWLTGDRLYFGGPLFLLYIALGVMLGVWERRRHAGGAFWPLSGTAVAAVGLLCASLWVPKFREYPPLRQDFPFESVAVRVPEPRPAGRPLPEPAAADLAALDEQVGRSADGPRARMLTQLHEDTTRLFVNTTGFGVSRMPRVPVRGWIEQRGRPGPPDQPAPRGTSAGDVHPADAGEVVAPGPDLREMHQTGAADFVNPEGWGLVRGRDRVAGFLPHRFSRVPNGPPRWEVETLELVGLLMHPEPVVYVSEKLPAMDQLRGAPSRPPDEFEAAGVAKLRAGEDYHAAGTADRLRMVASLRNGKACRTCHGGEYGDLLGAFSYALRAGKGP